VAWGPPDPSDPSWSYYQENPQWFLYNKPGFPSKQTILDARDHLLAANPELRVVGVHLGSMEKDIDNIASHLDQYPNFAVDMAARMEYLMIAPTDNVRAFLIKYQDRVLYGTDLDLLATADVTASLKEWESTYIRDWKFLATDETFDYEGRKVRGLKTTGNGSAENFSGKCLCTGFTACDARYLPRSIFTRKLTLLLPPSARRNRFSVRGSRSGKENEEPGPSL